MLSMLLVCLTFGVLQGKAKPIVYDKPVTVVLKNGRKITGMIDQESTKKALWLRLESHRIELKVEIAWNRVRHIRFGKSASLTANELKDSLGRYRTAGIKRLGPEPWLVPHKRNRTTTRVNRVASVQVEVSLANWDHDEEPDGYEIRVVPLSSDRRVVAVNGQLRVKLIGQKVNTVVLPNPLIQLERWGRPVRVKDFSKQGDSSTAPTYRLLFRRIRPERDRTLASLGKLVIHLDVPGQRTFSTTLETRIRRFRTQ